MKKHDHNNRLNNRTKARRYMAVWTALVLSLSLLTVPALAAGSDPLAIVNNMAWQYIGQLIFNMLVLTGLVKGASRIAKEMFGL